MIDQLPQPNRIWIHRISHEMELSHPLLNRGLLTIGYHRWSTTEFLNDVRGDNGWGKLDEKFMEIMGRYPRNRYSLWRFLNEMNEGDWVIVPSWGVFSVYRIRARARTLREPGIQSSEAFADLKNWHQQEIKLENGCLTRPSESDDHPHQYDLGFFMEVEPIMVDISRHDYADAQLTSTMKFRGTTKDCSTLIASVQDALRAAEAKQPINLHSQILDLSQDGVLKLLQTQLKPDKLETLICWYFRNMGASSVSIPAKNERGKEGDGDIIATFDPLRTIYYVQAKHHVGESNDWAVQQITTYTDQKSNLDTEEGYTHIPWVISTAESFSTEAIKLAEENNVLLLNGIDFARMILETGVSSLDSAFS